MGWSLLIFVGEPEAKLDGNSDRTCVGIKLGPKDGAFDGVSEGKMLSVGCWEATLLGMAEGRVDGIIVALLAAAQIPPTLSMDITSFEMSSKRSFTLCATTSATPTPSVLSSMSRLS